jgi:hypothetical protein
MSEKLLPCPFCGVAPTPYRGEVIVTVGCDNNECPARECYCSMPLAYETEAIAAWNRRTPAPEGEAVAALRALVRDCLANDFNELWDSYTAAQATLAASPVVPVGRGEIARKKVLDELDRAWLHGRWDHPWERQKAADAILAALGTKATDTGREG